MIFPREASPPAGPEKTSHFHQPADGRGKIPIDILALRQISELRIGSTNRMPVKADFPGFEGQQAAERLEQSAFAGPVRADERDAAAAFPRKADMMQGGDAIV